MQNQLVKLTTLNELAFTGVAQRLARRAHNPEVVCSNHTAGILQFGGFPEATSLLLQTLNTGSLYRDGAAAARGADNPEVTGSKPVPGIFTLLVLQKRVVYALDTKFSTIRSRYSSAAERLKTRLLPFRLFGSDLGMVIHS